VTILLDMTPLRENAVAIGTRRVLRATPPGKPGPVFYRTNCSCNNHVSYIVTYVDNYSHGAPKLLVGHRLIGSVACRKRTFMFN